MKIIFHETKKIAVIALVIIFLGMFSQVFGVNMYPVPTRTLKYGAKGNDVKWVQNQLNKYFGKIQFKMDGIFDKNMKNAVKKFQKDKKLQVDGVVGSQTRKKLKEYGTDIMLMEIKVSNKPTKLDYVQGENFNSEGLMIVATYSNNTYKEIKDYVIEDGNKLSLGKTNVTISYKEDNVIKKVKIDIKVTEPRSGGRSIEKSAELVQINVIKAPKKVKYEVGENFDESGMVAEAKYSDNSKKIIDNYEIIDGKKLQAGKKSVTIKYTENEIIKTNVVAIQVNQSKEQAKKEKQQAIVAFARKQIGKKYVMNAEGPNSFDCSGLTLYVYKNVLRIKLPHSASAQASYGQEVKFSKNKGKIDCSNMQLGDLIIFQGHAAIYAGNGKMIDAGNKRVNVSERNFYNVSYWVSRIKTVRRLVK